MLPNYFPIVTSYVTPKSRVYSTTATSKRKTEQKQSLTPRLTFDETIDSQRNVLETLFYTFEYKYMEDWMDGVQTKIIQSGGRHLLEKYSNNLIQLLSSIYPNYPWNFDRLKYKPRDYFSSKESQRNFMNQLYYTLKLRRFTDFASLPKAKIVEYGGAILLKQNLNDVKTLLSNVYPNYPWNYVVDLHNKESQREFLNILFIKLGMNSLGEWSNVSSKVLIENGGKSLLDIYQNNMARLLSGVYPNYPWNGISIDVLTQFTTLEEQRGYMNFLYTKLQLQSIDEWLLVPKTKVSENGGRKLLERYSWDWKRLLSSVYPEHNWDFSQLLPNFVSILHQREFMKTLFEKLKLESLDDWVNVSTSKITANGGHFLLKYYSNDIKRLLSSVYPHHTFNFQIRHFKSSDTEDVEFQREFMEQLYRRLNFSSFEGWSNLKKWMITSQGGSYILSLYKDDLHALLSHVYPNYPWKPYHTLHVKYNYMVESDQKKYLEYLYHKLQFQYLSDWFSADSAQLLPLLNRVLRYYSFNLNSLLFTIYPNYPWKFRWRFRSYKRNFLEHLFHVFELNNLNDWLSIPHSQFIEHGGKHLFNSHLPNVRSLLSFIYPNFPWNLVLSNKRSAFRDRSFQRQYLERLFHSFQLKTLEDWCTVSVLRIRNHGGGPLLNLYSNNLRNILSSVYPNFIWESLDISHSSSLHLVSLQRKYMCKLFVKLRLKTLDEFLYMKRTILRKTQSLSRYYKNWRSLFTTIFPNFPWEFTSMLPKNHFISQTNQREFMNSLFLRLRFKSLDSWVYFPKNRLTLYGGQTLLKHFSFNWMNLLRTIYPNYPFYYNFRNMYFKKVRFLVEQFEITRKKDWYRVGAVPDLSVILKTCYPEEKWDKRLLSTKNKKYKQRILYIHARKFFSPHLILENYKYPFSTCSLEFDIFLPSLSFALEYQGEQHFNDLPAIFTFNESYLMRDDTKIELSNLNYIYLLPVPFWWDQTESSFIKSIDNYRSWITQIKRETPLLIS